MTRPELDSLIARRAQCCLTDMLRRHINEATERKKRETEKLTARRKEVIQHQRRQRAELEKAADFLSLATVPAAAKTLTIGVESAGAG